jgi:hypothetical protein
MPRKDKQPCFSQEFLKDKFQSLKEELKQRSVDNPYKVKTKEMSFCLWMKRVRKSETSPKEEDGDRYHLNIQESSKFDDGVQNDKLGLEINEEGLVMSVMVDGKSIPPAKHDTTLFKPHSIWNNRLTEISKTILKDTKQQKQGVIDPFPWEGHTPESWEDWITVAKEEDTLDLVYTGRVVAGKAEGRGTISFKNSEYYIIHGEFRDGEIQENAVAVHTWEGGAWAGDMECCGPPDTDEEGPTRCAWGTLVREDGGRFEGTWPDARSRCETSPETGAAWDPSDGSVFSVNNRDKDAGEYSNLTDSGWMLGEPRWVKLGVLTGLDGKVLAPTSPSLLLRG